MSEILEYAKEILNQEKSAIEKLSSLIDVSFEHSVKLILGLQKHGHVICSGMGKAGIIAQKVSATLASIGIPSFFLHPAEAIHGDIGRFTKFDVALLFSNSGQTEEVLKMIPAIKRIGCPVISVTSDLQSELSNHSDIVLNLGKITEAGPLQMAPTTSTTAMLALGDALAMTLLWQKGLTKEEYAFYHPGGSLGRSLMTVDQIMRSNQELCMVSKNLSCKEVLEKITLTKGRPGAALVIDESKKLCGIFTDGDLRRCLNSGTEFLENPISAVMGSRPKSIKLGKLASEATKMLTDYEIDQLPVVDDDNRPVGLIDIQDVVKFGFI